MQIILFASSDFSLPLLDIINNSNHKLCAIYTQPPSISGRGMRLRDNAISIKAKELNIQLFYPSNVNKITEINKFKSLNPDIAIVSAYGQILSSNLLKVPKFGFLNLHPSLLPRWRGAAPIERALMSGDKETGICTMKMVRELDSGPILAREKFAINPNETNTSLSYKLSKIGALQLLEVINNFEFISEIPQENDGITYASKIQKSETRINWNLSGIVVDRLIRSLSEKPGAWCILNGSRVKILNSKYVKLEGKTGHNIVSSANKSSLIIACREGAVEIITLQKEGKKPISAKEFLSGYKENNIFFD